MRINNHWSKVEMGSSHAIRIREAMACQHKPVFQGQARVAHVCGSLGCELADTAASQHMTSYAQPSHLPVQLTERWDVTKWIRLVTFAPS